VHVGMVAARLGWALLPLVPLALSRFARGDHAGSVSGAAVVAAIALLHPAHLPTAVVFVLLAAAVRPERRARRLAHASALLALATGVTAFWTLPLLFRLSSARALAWGALSVPAVPFAVALGVAALPALRLSAPPLERALARWPWVTLGVVILDRVVLEPLGVRWLPADRVADGAFMGFVLAAGLVLGRALASVPARAGGRALAVAMAIVLVTLLSLPGRALYLWPARGVWPFYAMTVAGLRLQMLWERLEAAPPGRVLFVRSGIPLVHGTAWYRPHTHITSLTPRTAGRAIVHGTFTHPSLTAAYLYRGRLDGGAITTLAEQLDGHTLFGRPLRELVDVLQSDVGERLGIGTVVALEDDAPELARLTESRAFVSTWLPPFVVYTRRQPMALPLVVETSRWILAVRAEPGAWVTARMTHYPLWRAEVDGQPRATRRGPAGDLEVRLERPDETVTLVYAAGLPEMIGTGLSVATVIGLAAMTVRRRLVSGSGPSASGGSGSPARTGRSTA